MREQGVGATQENDHMTRHYPSQGLCAQSCDISALSPSRLAGINHRLALQTKHPRPNLIINHKGVYPQNFTYPALTWRTCTTVGTQRERLPSLRCRQRQCAKTLWELAGDASELVLFFLPCDGDKSGRVKQTDLRVLYFKQ